MASHRVVYIPNISLSVNASLSVNNREAATDITPIPMVNRMRSERGCSGRRRFARRESRRVREMIRQRIPDAFRIDPIPGDCHRFPVTVDDQRLQFDFHLFRETCSRKSPVRHPFVTRQREKKKRKLARCVTSWSPSLSAIRGFA